MPAYSRPRIDEQDVSHYSPGGVSLYYNALAIPPLLIYRARAARSVDFFLVLLYDYIIYSGAVVKIFWPLSQPDSITQHLLAWARPRVDEVFSSTVLVLVLPPQRTDGDSFISPPGRDGFCGQNDQHTQETSTRHSKSLFPSTHIGVTLILLGPRRPFVSSLLLFTSVFLLLFLLPLPAD